MLPLCQKESALETIRMKVYTPYSFTFMTINLNFICKDLHEDSFWNRGSRYNVTRTRCIDCVVPKPKRLQYNGHAITAIVSKHNEPMRSRSKDAWPAPSESQVTVSLGITSHWFSWWRKKLMPNWAFSWCRRPRTRHSRTPPQKRIVFIVFLVLLSFCSLLFYINRVFYTK